MVSPPAETGSSDGCSLGAQTSPFFSRRLYTPIFSFLSFFLSLFISISYIYFYLSSLLRQVNAPIRTREPTRTRTQETRFVSFGPLLARQLATVRPPHGRKYRVSEYYPSRRILFERATDSRDTSERYKIRTSLSAKCKKKKFNNRPIFIVFSRIRFIFPPLVSRITVTFAILHESPYMRREGCAPGAR